MKQVVTWRRLEPNTISGEGIEVTTTITSFDKKEINALAEVYKKTIGYGVYMGDESEGNYERQEDAIHRPNLP